MMLRAALAAALFVAPPAWAEFDAATTAAEAAFALLEADGARDRVEALTQTVRAYEEGLLALREGIRQAAQREQTILLVFEAERDRLSRLLGVLQSIEGAPAPLLMMHPEGAIGTARSGMIVSEITPAVAANAETITVIGATTRSGMLTAPLRDRFVHQERLTYYEQTELVEIVRVNAEKLSVGIEAEAAHEIAVRCRGTPRRATCSRPTRICS